MSGVIVVGAGMGGLSAAAILAARGHDVTVLERADHVGGKARVCAGVDCGPTVLTMRWALERVFEEAGGSLDAEAPLDRAETLARHMWDGDARLDLHADLDRSAQAVAEFAGAQEAKGFLRFHADARRVFETLRDPYLTGPRTNPLRLTLDVGLGRLPDLLGIRPFETLWAALGDYFRDPRLRQLYARYATYCGSSPFRAPATLMLIAHVEQDGVWLPRHGMRSIPEALARLATRQGARVRLGADITKILIARGRAAGVETATGERLAASAVILNADPAALAAGAFGDDIRSAIDGAPLRSRSLSAITWALNAQTDAPLDRHNVFFSSDYEAEFAALAAGRMPSDPTIYVCAQDRPQAAGGAPERLFILVNAPADADRGARSAKELSTCQDAAFRKLAQSGLHLRPTADPIVTTPSDFARLFPGSGGALYGPASHGWAASFTRPAARTRLPGLYLAGGSTHPGPGLPMAALSGRQSALALERDRASTRPSPQAATSGGTWTASPTTAPAD